MGRCKHQPDGSRGKAWAWLSKDNLSLSFPALILGEERQDAVGAVMDPALAEARPGQDRSPPIRPVAGGTRPLVGRA